jgi:hypothetical protein
MMRSVPPAHREHQDTFTWYSHLDENHIANCMEIKYRAQTGDAAFYRDAIVGRIEEVDARLQSRGVSARESRRAIFDVMFALFMCDEFNFLSEAEIVRRAEMEAADGSPE